MKDPFALEARYYDKIWGSTCSYPEEAKFLHQVFSDHGVHRVLDVACGTGGHLVELAKLGYSVVGMDISETMLRLAREKARMAGIKARFILGNMTDLFSVLKKEKVIASFDAITRLGISLAHMTDDISLNNTLREMRKVLRKKGILAFSVKNAKLIREDRIQRLIIDKLIDEQALSLALLGYTFRDSTSPNILIWNSIYLIKEHGKIDFQISTHPLRWFHYNNLTKLLESNKLKVIHVYGDTLGLKEFNENLHEIIFVICQKSDS